MAFDRFTAQARFDTVIQPGAISTPPDRLTARRARRARELTLHALLLAVAVWVTVAADVVSPGPLGRFSNAHKGNDFVQFYVMASLAGAGTYDALVDEAQFRNAQSGYIIAGTDVSYPAVYGPHVALSLVPLAWLEYQHAYALFSAVTLLLVAFSVWVLWRRSRALHGWGRPTAAIAAAFPPLGYLILNGQLSALALAAFSLLAAGLSCRSRVVAGLALGLLGYKYSLLVPALAVCVLAGEWAIATAAVSFVVLQLLAASSFVGLDVVRDFLGNTAAVAGNPDVLVRRPYLMGSLRTFWAGLLPGAPAQLAYAVTAAACVGLGAWAWRRTNDPVCRAGLLSLVIALTAPHFYLYDLVIVAPAFLASASILLTRRRPALRWTTYAAFLAPLAVPATFATGIHFVTIALVAWFLSLAFHVGWRERGGASTQENPLVA